MLCNNSRRVVGSSFSSLSISVLLAPAIAASGVRKSCDTALKSEFRSRSVSTSTLVCSASRDNRSRSIETAACPANASTK